MKVSLERYERDASDIMRTAEKTTKRSDPEAVAAAKEMERDITVEEFLEELGKMKDAAPGLENVRVSAVKAMSTGAKKKLFCSMLKHLDSPPNEWPEETKERWVIPLHKKGARDKLDNYRGVCLLPLISRIIARIFASRIRRWAEKIGALGENQNGFREWRSTCDATQTILRVDEEVRRVKGPCKEMRTDRPGAVLLDITKAYPRVNRPLLWKVLENLGMTKKVLDLMKGLYEETKYRIKGREGLSKVLQPERGLREGDATSPILFNLYHEQSMKLALDTRHESARRSGKECGLRWA